MGECMVFPEDYKEFIDSYSFKDKQEVYTNGSELIPVFRVEQMMDHYMPLRKMTVREFKEFCCVSDIVLKDSFTGRVYTKIDNYLDREVRGFYPRFNLANSNDSYNPWCRLQIVAWISHDFTEEGKDEK